MKRPCRRPNLGLLVDPLERRTLLSSYVPIAGIHDFVYDSTRNMVDATTSSGTVVQYDVASGQTQVRFSTTSLAFQTDDNLMGADITPDDNFLYAADVLNNPVILKIDLSNWTSTVLSYDLTQGGGSFPFDVAIAGTHAFFTSSNMTPTQTSVLRQIDLATDTITARDDLPPVISRSVLARSADGGTMFLTEPANLTGGIHLYNAAQNAFTASATIPNPTISPLQGLSHDGKYLAFSAGGGVVIYDTTTFKVVTTLPKLDGGFCFDPSSNLIYGVNSTSDQLVGYDIDARAQRFSVPLGRNLFNGSLFASGMMVIGNHKAFISDGAGILTVDIPQPTGQAATLQVGGYSEFALQGFAGTVHVQAIDASGYPAVDYRGTISISSSDPAASFPSSYTFTAADNGSADIPVTLATVGTQSITVRDSSNSLLTAQLGNLVVHANDPTLIPLTNRRKDVYDPKRQRLYFTTSSGLVERYDLATQTLLQPLTFGSNLNGIDISSDDRWLVLEDGISTGQSGHYVVVDLNQIDAVGIDPSSIATIMYFNSTGEAASWDVARTVRGTFVADDQYSGSGWVTPREIDPITDTAVRLPGRGDVRQNTGIGRSPDGRYLIFTENNISSGPVMVFDTLTDTSVSSINTESFLDGQSGAVNPDGTLFAIRLNGTRIYNRSLQLVTILPNVDGGAAFDPVSGLFYGVNSTTNRIDVYRPTDWSIINSIPIGEDVPQSSAMNNGVMTFGDGAIFLSTPSGIRIIRVQPVAIAGNYAVVEGASVTLSGGSIPPPNLSVTQYEWDLDYDGVTFTTDAIGPTALFSAASSDGPSMRTIALRVTDSRGLISNISVGQVSIGNAPPTALFGADGLVIAGFPATVRFSNVFDPSPADMAGGFHYSYDFNNDGTFEITNSTSSSATVPASMLTAPGTYAIHGRVIDKDGGFTDYLATLTAATPASVSGIVFGDTNNNGALDAQEKGAAGLTVYLDANGNNQLDAADPATTTDSLGAYRFTSVWPATYTVRLLLPAGWHESDDGSDIAFTYGPNTVVTDLNLGVQSPPIPSAGGPYSVAEGSSVNLNGSNSQEIGGTIAKYEWDTNYNGTTFVARATGISTSFSAVGLDGPSSRAIALRVTDANGITSVATGSVTINNAPPKATFAAGGAVTLGSAGSVSFTAASDPSPADVTAGFKYSYDFNNDGTFETANSTSTTATVPASYLSTTGAHTIHGRIIDKDGGFTDYTTTIQVNAAAGASISGLVYNDANGNGVRDSGEAVVSGQKLFIDKNTNSILDAGEPTFATGAAGTFTFSGLAAGTYRIREVAMSGWRWTNPTSGYYNVTVTANQVVTGKSFGETTNTLISGIVFKDANANAKLDTGEVALSGWVVYLDTNNNGILDTGEKSFTTGTDGKFSFVVPAGTYHLREVLKSGFTITTPAGGLYTLTLASGQSATGKNFGDK